MPAQYANTISQEDKIAFTSIPAAQLSMDAAKQTLEISVELAKTMQETSAHFSIIFAKAPRPGQQAQLSYALSAVFCAEFTRTRSGLEAPPTCTLAQIHRAKEEKGAAAEHIMSMAVAFKQSKEAAKAAPFTQAELVATAARLTKKFELCSLTGKRTLSTVKDGSLFHLRWPLPMLLQGALASATVKAGAVLTRAAMPLMLTANYLNPAIADQVHVALPELPPPHVIRIDWIKKTEKFGLSMVPAQDGNGVYIDASKRGSTAGAYRDLRPGVFIDSINGVSVAQGTLEDVIQAVDMASRPSADVPGRCQGWSRSDIQMSVVYDPVGYARAVAKRERAMTSEEKKATKTENLVKADMACRRAGTAFGLQLVDSSTGEGVYLVDLFDTLDGSVASKSKVLQPGLRFTKVNKTDVSMFNQGDLTKLLAKCKADIKLELAKDSIGYARALAFEKITTTIPGCAELLQQSPFFVRCLLAKQCNALGAQEVNGGGLSKNAKQMEDIVRRVTEGTGPTTDTMTKVQTLVEATALASQREALSEEVAKAIAVFHQETGVKV